MNQQKNSDIVSNVKAEPRRANPTAQNAEPTSLTNNPAVGSSDLLGFPSC